MLAVRFVPLLQQLGGRVIVQCQSPLRRLLSSCLKPEDLVAQGEPLPQFDVFAPLLSLPGLLRISPAQVPAKVPYLHANAGLVQRWQRELGPLKGFKVGIAWQGNPTAPGDRQRSIPLARFARLGQVEGVNLISLQKGPGTEQLAAVGSCLPILDLGSRLDETAGAFMDTAAIIVNLDLVISADTAIAHLAGTLAAPVLGGASVSARLALVASARGQPLVSEHAALPPRVFERLGGCFRAYGHRTGVVLESWL